MQKSILILCLLSFSLMISQSQSSLNINRSNSYKDKFNSTNVLAIHTTEDDNTTIIRSSKNEYLFEIFDKNLNNTFSKTIKKEKKEIHLGDLFMNDELKFFTVQSPKKDTRILHCYTLELDSKKITKSTIFKKSVEKKQSLFGSSRNHKTRLALSPNFKFFAIAFDNIRKNKNSYTIQVYDSETEKLIYEKSYQESVDDHFIHNDLFVDDNANVYSLGKLYDKGRFEEKFDGSANYKFMLYKLSESETSKLEVELDDELIQFLSITKDENQLHLIGFYSIKNSGRVKGGCDLIIDNNTFTLVDKKKIPLPETVYNDLYGYRTAQRKNKKKKELKNFYIDHILEDSKGNTYIIAEEFYITSNYVNTGYGGYVQTVNHYDDLLILKFGNGGLKWGRSVYKRSTAPSYNAFIKNDELHILLNSGKNLIEKSDGRTKVSKGFFESTSLYDIAYTTDGNVTYNKLQDNSRKSFFLPFYGTYKNDRFIMMSDVKKARSFMILD